ESDSDAKTKTDNSDANGKDGNNHDRVDKDSEAQEKAEDKKGTTTDESDSDAKTKTDNSDANGKDGNNHDRVDKDSEAQEKAEDKETANGKGRDGESLRSASQDNNSDESTLKPSDLLDDGGDDLFSSNGPQGSVGGDVDPLNPFNMEQAAHEDLNQEGDV
ncbi:MAG: hypothetical protein U1E26_06095, partial [Coriobacteriia bacterium]|nr:hypothetical protein [Coriobacteriia bacterium]